MERLQIRFSREEYTALLSAAWAHRREAREMAEFVLRRWLVRRGYLDDPTAAGKLRKVEKQNPDAVSLDGGAASGATTSAQKAGGVT